MELPYDVLQIIREYSRPCRNWRKGSYLYQYYKSNCMSFLNDLKIHIVENFRVCFLERLQMQYYLLTHSYVYKKNKSKLFNIYLRKIQLKSLIEKNIRIKEWMESLDRIHHYTL